MPELEALPPVVNHSLSVILLAHNEEPHVEVVVQNWLVVLQNLGCDYEILLVDDGSRDATPAKIAALAASYSRIQVLRHQARRGIGAALRTGLAAASKSLVFYTTCDRQYAPTDLAALLAEIDKLHLVSGFRRWQGMPSGLRLLGYFYRGILRIFFGIGLPPLLGWLGWREWLYRLFVRAVFGIRLHDVNCAFRLFRREIFARIPIQSDGTFVHTEVVAKANFLGCYMNDEIPITYHPQRVDANNPSDANLWTWWGDFHRVFSEPTFSTRVIPLPKLR